MSRTTETPEYQAEYQRAYQAVLTAHANGYHKPYNNLSSDEAEGRGYDDGFRAAQHLIASLRKAQEVA